MTKANPCMDPDEPAGRLTLSRIKAGYKYAAQVARELKIPAQTYRSHEDGTRGFDLGQATSYAELFGVDVGYIMHGKEGPARPPHRAYPREVILGTLVEGVKVARALRGTPEFVAGIILEALELYPIDEGVRDPAVSARIVLARHKKKVES